MAAKKRTRKRRLVLDIGASAIRMCELVATKAGYQVAKYFQREMLIDPSADEETKRQTRAETLKALLKDSKARSKKVIMGVPGQSVFTRPRPLPPVPEYKLTQIVRYEIQQQIPFSLDQIALDYQVLSRTEAGGYNVLMAAIKVDIVERYLDVISDAKCRIDTVDVCPLAAYNWLQMSGEFGDQGECVALLDIGAATTDIVISRDNQFQWNRPLSIGGNDITQAIASEFNVGFAEAEKLKRERGFAPTGDPQRDGKAGEVIGRVLNRMVSEINRSFSYYRAQPGGAPIQRIVVTGGGACLRNMIPFLQRQLGVEVRIAQPLAGVAIGPGAQEVNEHPEQAAVVLGLALRCCQPLPVEINLIPPRVYEAAKRRERAFYWGLSIATLLLIGAAYIPVIEHQRQQVNANVAQLEEAILQFDRSLAPDLDQRNVSAARSEYEDELRDIQDEVDRYRRLSETIDEAFERRVPWLEYISAVQNARPEGEGQGVWISAIESTRIGEEAGRMGGMGMPGMPGMGGMGMPGMPGMGGMGGGPGGMGGMGGDGGRDQRPMVPSSGFPGISPRGAMGGMGGMGMGMPGMGGGGGMGMPGMGGGGMPGMGGMGMPGMGGQQQEAAQVPQPNGIIIRGYASDEEALTEFRNRLEASDVFIDGGVYWDERFINRVDYSAIYNADIGTGGMGAMGGRGGAGGMTGGMGGRTGGGMPGGMMGRQTGGFTSGRRVIEFRIDLQFRGERFDPDRQQTGTGFGMPGMGGMGAMGGMGMQQDGDGDDDMPGLGTGRAGGN